MATTTTTAPKTTILNLDEILAAEPQRSVIWQGQTFPVVGMTGEGYLQYLVARRKLEAAIAANDDAEQWKSNLQIIGILAPTLADKQAEMQKLSVAALTALVEYMLADVADTMPSVPAKTGKAEPAGE